MLAYHAQAAGLAQAAFQHSLVAGREALRVSAVSDAMVHFERARRVLLAAPPAEMPGRKDIKDLYVLLSRAYTLDGQAEKAQELDAEKERFVQAD